jgi:spermidine synthase
MIGGGITAYEKYYPSLEVRRDAEATTMAFTREDGLKMLAVNGYGMTTLTPLTKFMAHMPLALAANRPGDSLIVAFGMGTTYRSALSWGGQVTAVDLVPSVPALFPYFHPDAAALAAGGRGRVVIDDGRRFLARTRTYYDVITVDPPPPVCSPASGLLYSGEFYAVAASRLKPGGVLQQWVPGSDFPDMIPAAARSLLESFPHVRAFVGVVGGGVHFLASASPLPRVNPAELARRLPPAARADLEEWGPEPTALKQAAAFLANEVDPRALLAEGALSPRISDDRPFNEYYLLRRLFPGALGRWNRALAVPLPQHGGAPQNIVK